MTTHRRFCFARALFSGAALLIAGCMGGQTGGEIVEDPARPSTPVSEDGACQEQPRPVALADASLLGFSGSDVLAGTLGTHRAPLHWKPTAGVIGFGPEHGESTIDVTIEYRAGEVRFVEAAPMTSEGSGAEPAMSCRPNHLEIDVVVRVVTAGGALAEEFQAALVALTPSRAELTRRIPVADLAGSFFVTAPEGHVVAPLDINVYFDAGGFSGTLNGAVEQQVGRDPNGSVGVTFVPFASWP